MSDGGASGVDIEIQINTANNLEGRQTMIDRLDGLVTERLARLDSRLTRVELHATDVNGDRTNGPDVRCQIEARPSGLAPLSVTEQGDRLPELWAS